jgi:hypothetical protein
MKKRTVVDVTKEIHADLALIAKIAGTRIKDEVDTALSAYLAQRWNEPGIKDAINRINDKSKEHDNGLCKDQD